MTFRRRMNRKADSGIPGYDNLGRLNMGHPATKELPEVDQYGFDNEFGEGVRKGPYLSGPPPASVGWMPEHPATKKSLVEDYEIGQELHDANIKKAMERKANKCIAIAEHRLGRTASAREIESLALRLMDLPNNSINSKFASATDFLASQAHVGMDEMGMDEMGMDEMGMDEMGMDEMGMDEMGMDEMGMDGSDDLATLMAELEGKASYKQASFRRNRRASLRGRRASMYATHHMSDESDELATLMADLEAGDELQNATGYHGSDIGPGNRNADFDGGIMGYDEFDGGMMMEDDFSDAMSPVDVLAEQISHLKQANAKLKHRLRKAEEAVQDATGYHGEEDSVQPAGRYKEPGEGSPTARYASKNGLKRLANVLADYLAEEEGPMASHGHMSSFMAEDDQDSVMAEILAELEGGYDPEVSQNDNQFGYSENLIGEDDSESSVAEMLASMLAEEQAKKKAAAKKAPAKAEKASAKKESEDPMGLDENADDEGTDPKLASLFAKFAEEDEEDEGEVAEEEKKATKSKSAAAKAKAEKASAKSEKASAKSEKLAEKDADAEEADEDEPKSKKSSKGEKPSKKAFEWKFSAEEADEDEGVEADEDEGVEADEDEETSKKASWRFADDEGEEADEDEGVEADEDEETSKKASFSPRPSINSRKASVKTLGNISRTASKSDSNELSKLWESAPDVSKYFS